MSEPVIYVIAHDVSGKAYVGSTNSWRRRSGEHKSMLRNGRHCNVHLQSAWAKYGEAAFTFMVLERLPGPQRIVEREQLWINLLAAATVGYNMCPAAGTTRGRPCSPERKAKISIANTGRVRSEASRALIRAARARQVLTPESIAKTQASNTGRKRTDEFRARASAAQTGKPVSPETRAKLSAINLGKKASAETKAKMAESQKAAQARRKALLASPELTYAPSED